MSEEKKIEVMEVTQEQLKEMLVPLITEVMKAMPAPTILPTKTEAEAKEEKMEEAKKFLCDLAEGKGERKAIDTTSGSFGYAVPTTLASAILEKRANIAAIRPYAFAFKMAGKFQLPLEDLNGEAYWVGENEPIDEDEDIKLAKQDLDDYYLAKRILIPRKLLNTAAYNIVQFVATLAGKKIAETEDTAFVAGDGSEKPTGIRQTVGVTGVPQAGEGLAYVDLTNLWYSLKKQYRKNAVWMLNATGMKLVRALNDLYGRPIFDMRDETIWNKPVIETEDIPDDLGTDTNETEIWLVDLSYYWIKDGEDLFILQQPIISALQLEVVIAEAVDGAFMMPEAAVKLTGVKAAEEE